MPSVDQVTSLEHNGVNESQDDAKTKSNNMHEKCFGDTATGSLEMDGEVIDAKVKQNGHITMETKPTKTVNAHLVKNDVICLDKTPVKSVMIETNGTELSDDKDTIVSEKVEKEECSEALKPNGEMSKCVDSKGKCDDETESCSCKKPMSFELLRREISKDLGLASRQRHKSESSYKKQNYRMSHTNSDPTELFSSVTVFEDVKDIKSKNEGNLKGKNEEGKVSDSAKRDSEVNSLAENLGSALKISSASSSENKDGVKKETDKRVSDLADDLKTCLHIKNQEDKSGSKVIIVKKEDVSVSPNEEIIIKEEPDEVEEKSAGGIEIKQEPKDETTESYKKDDVNAGRFSEKIQENSKSAMVSRGIQDGNMEIQSVPLQGLHFYQQSSYQHNTNITIPSFQEAFVHTGQMQQRQVQMQRRYVQQPVQPPRYMEAHQPQQQIILPPSTQGNQTIIVPPAATSANHQRLANSSSMFYSPQVQTQPFGMTNYPFQNSYLPLQEPQPSDMVVLPSSRQPEENVWPGAHDDISDTTSISSPYRGDEIDSIASPASDVVFNQVNSPISSQGSPYPVPTSPLNYHTVPSLSPEMPIAYSPSAVSSPGSPHSHTIKTGVGNIGEVTINDPTQAGGKRQRLSGQRLSESDAKTQDIGKIIEYLKQDSPGSPHDQNPSSPGNYQPVSPADSSSSSITPPPPTPMPPYQHAPQPSPPPGMSPITAIREQRYQYQPEHHTGIIPAHTGIVPAHSGVVPAQPGYYPGTTPLVHTKQPPVDAVVPNQVANQQDYELQEWRQKVAKLSKAQLREQDEDKDTVLHLAVIQEEKYLMIAVVEQLGADGINMKNKQSQTSVYLAAVTNQPELVYYLICNGADPTIPAEQAGNTPLHYAAQQGFVKVIEAIMEGLAQLPEDFIDSKNFEGKSPLHCAVEAHDMPFMDTLGKMETIDSRQTIEVLMRYGASAKCQDGKSGKTALHYAVERHQLEIARLLLDRCDNAGELVNCQMYNGNTALHLIVGRQEIPMEEIREVVWLLMSRGANVSIENAEKDTPLKLVQVGHDAIKKHLQGQSHR